MEAGVVVFKAVGGEGAAFRAAGSGGEEAEDDRIRTDVPRSEARSVILKP